MDKIIVYCTFANRVEAERITLALLEARLVACGNLTGGASYYWWDKAVQSADEVYGVYKTTRAHYGAVEAMVQEIHSYEVPCVVAVPIEAGLPAYLNWIDAETA